MASPNPQSLPGVKAEFEMLVDGAQNQGVVEKDTVIEDMHTR